MDQLTYLNMTNAQRAEHDAQQHCIDRSRASPASVPAGWEVSSDEDQEAIRESENAGDCGKLFLTTVDGAHSCSIWCWGGTQDIADEQAQTIERLAAAPTPPVSEDRQDAERYHKLANYMISARFDIDDALVAAASKDEISSILDAMQEDKP